MNKKISLFVAILLLLNFIIPCVCTRSFAAAASGTIGDSGGVISFLSESIAGSVYSFPYASMTVKTSGLYTVTVHYNSSSGTDFDILKGSDNRPVAVAGKSTDTGIPSQCSKASRQVTVYLEAGQTYNVPIYQSWAGAGNHYELLVNPYEVPASGYKEYECSSADYTNIRHRSSSFASDINPYGSNYKGINYQGGTRVHSGDFSTGSTTNLDDGVTEKQVSTLQWLVTQFFIYAICEPIKAIINSMFGPVTIDKILFNHFNNTKLTFYPENGKESPADWNEYLCVSASNSKTVLDVINEYYNYFKGLAISIYVILLLYIAIRVVLKSTAKDRERYKELLTDWVKGVFILFIFPYVIKYMILLNESLVELIEDVALTTWGADAKTNFWPSSASDDEAYTLMGVHLGDAAKNNIMTKYKDYATKTGSLGFAFVYFYLIISVLSFILIYFKRLITIIFLIVLFPFVAVTYVMDKVKDGKAQVFNNWFRELVLNIYMQLFHAVSFVVVTTIIAALLVGEDGANANIILVVIALGYIKKSDELLKILFPSMMRGGGAGTVKPASQVMQTAATVGVINQLKKKGNDYKARFSNAHNRVSQARNTGYEWRRRNNLEATSKIEAKEERQRIAAAGVAMDDVVSTFNSNSGSLLQQAQTNPQNQNAGQNTTGTGTADQTQSGATGGQTVPPTPRITQSQEAALMNAVDKVAAVYHIPEKKAEFKAKLEQTGLTQEQKQRVLALVDAKSRMDQVLTGKTKEGVPLSRLQLNMNVKILNDVINSPNALNPATAEGMLKKQLENSKVVVKRKKYTIDNREVTKEEYFKEKQKAEQIADETLKKRALSRIRAEDKKVEISGLEYFNEEVAKGKLHTKTSLKQARSANAWIGNMSGVNMGEIRRDADGNEYIANDMEVAFDENGNADLESVAAQRISRAGKKFGSMSSKQSKKFLDEHEEDISDLVEQFGDYTNAESSERVREGAGILVKLQDYQEKMMADANGQKQIDGVDAREMHKLTARLNQLQKLDENVSRMVAQTVDTGKTERIAGTQNEVPVQVAGAQLRSGKEIKINFGASLDAMEAAAATAVLAIPTEEMEDGDGAAMKSAASSLRRINEESDDNAALTFVNRSEHDDVLDAKDLSEVIDDEYGFIGSRDKTQEEIILEKFTEEKINLRIQMSDEGKAKLKNQFFSETLQATGSVLSATLGTAADISLGIAGTGIVGGASAETSGKNMASTYSLASNLESLLEKPISGAYKANEHSIGNSILNAVTNHANNNAENAPLEANSDEQRKLVDDSIAKARTDAIRDKMKRS